MRIPNARRIGVVAWPAVVGGVLLAACGAGDDAAPSRSTIELNQGSTAFVVKEPATTVGSEEAGDGTVSTAQEYTVQAGDYPVKVAEQFGVPLDELIAFNEWGSASEFPFPGTVIRIPPGGTAQDQQSNQRNQGGGNQQASDQDDSDDSASATIPDAGDNCAEGSYTITEDDTTRIGVAEKFDVTVAALDAANAGTSGYSAFYPGLQIVIPAKSDC